MTSSTGPHSGGARAISHGSLETMDRIFKFRFLSMGFLWAWIYCLWFTPAVFPGRTGIAVNADISWLISVIVVTLTLLVTPLVLGNQRQLASWRWMRITAPALTAVGTLIGGITVLYPGNLIALAAIGAVMTGVGSGWLWITIGEFYSRIEQDHAEFLAPVSVIVVIVCLVIVSNMSGIAGTIAVSLLPVISGVLVAMSLRDPQVSAPVPIRSPKVSPDFWPDFLRVGLGTAVIYTVIAFVWSVVTLSELEMVGQGFQLPFVIGTAFAIILAGASILYSARLDAFTLYRWMLPVVVVSLTLLVYQTTLARTLSYMLITVAQVGFDIMIWLYFVSVARRGYRSAAIALGMSRGFAQVGVTAGSIVGPYLVARVSEGVFSPANLSLAWICILVIVVSFVLNRQAWFEKVVREEPERPKSPDERSSEEARYARIAERYGLSPREREVLVFLAHGRSLPYIREQLVLSKNTVDTHAKNLYRKLDVHTRQELIDLVDSNAQR